MGFSGLAAEILLLREMLILFSGNELSVGVIMANWLILEAFGNYVLGRTVERWKHKLEVFVLLSILFCVCLILTLFPLRNLKHILGVSIGEMVGLLTIFYSSFLILMPASVLHGALFTYGCRIYSLYTGKAASSAGRIYVYETLGTMIGGIASTYLFVLHLHTFQITVLVLLVHVIAGLFLMLPNRSSVRFGMWVLVLLLVLFPLSAYILFGGLADTLHRYTIRSQWRGMNVVHYQNSRYGNICVVENEGQYIYFIDGNAILMVPVPDVFSIEEFVHIPLLSHPKPEEILLISGGAGGVLDRILEHPAVEAVSYIELDPLVFSLLRKYPTPLTESELTAERVEIRQGDGRFHLKASDRSYDLIMIGIKELSSLQVNRFYTSEFFSLARQRLKREGILVIQIPGSLSLVNEELRDLNASIYHSLKSEFFHVRVFPGEDRNLLLASNSPHIVRLNRRDITQETMVPARVEKMLHEGWKRWFESFIEGRTHKVNTDFRPLGLFYSISYWNSLYSPGFGALFKRLEKLKLTNIMLAVLAALLIFLIMSRRRRFHPAHGIPLGILTTGFAGMIFDLVVLFAFQSIYGYVYSWMGLLIAAFMTGAAVGAVLMTELADRERGGLTLFLYTELGIILLALALPIVLRAAQDLSGTPGTLDMLKVLFLLIPVLCGLLTGAQFPLGNRLCLQRSPDVSRTAGLLYALDLIGGWIGGVAGAVVFLPVLGVTRTCAMVGLLKFASLVVIFRTRR